MYIFIKKRQFLRHVLREVPISGFSSTFSTPLTKFMGNITGYSRRCETAAIDCQSSQLLTGLLGLGLGRQSLCFGMAVSLEKKTNSLGAVKKSSLGTALNRQLTQLFSLGAEQKRKKIKMNASKIVNNLDKLISIEYSLDDYHRSNQDTCLVHKPSVFDGQWVQSGDLLADCSASVGGELALGQNILIAYMPWEGYNFEDAILVSERLVYDDLYTSVHIERYEVELRETKLGIEEITRQIPDVEESSLKHLNNFGIAKLGSWVEEGDILVGKVTPINKKIQSNYQKLLYTILDKTALPIRDSSLRAPKGIKAKVIGVQIFSSSSIRSKPIIRTKQDDQGFSNIREDKSQGTESGGSVKTKAGKSKIKSLKLTKSYLLEKNEATGHTKQLPWSYTDSPNKISLSLKKLGQVVPRRDATFNQSAIDSQEHVQPLKKLQKSACFNKNNSFFKLCGHSNKHGAEQSVGLIDLSSPPGGGMTANFIIGHNKFNLFSWRKEKSALIILKEKLKNKRSNNKKNFDASTKSHLYEHFGSFLRNRYTNRLATSSPTNKYIDSQINQNNTDQARVATSDNLYFLKNFFGNASSGQNLQINGLSIKQKSIDSIKKKK